jgi:4-hydroxy-3-methylbut-2-enyl diphosphate reductase
VEIARAEADRAERVFTLGPLIHNPRVLAELRSLGVEILDANNLPENLAGASVIIRAHGISPQTEARVREKGGRIIDATCPRVKASQLKAKALAESGCRLFLAGEAEHAEITGLRGYAGEASAVVVGSAVRAEEAAAALRASLQKEPSAPETQTALIAQTTISAEEYRSIGEAVKKYFPDLNIIQSICAATGERQESLRELLREVDAVIVAGGKESANTRRLLAIAEEQGKPCVLAESAGEVPAAFAAYQTVGICAGASTPDTVIDGIEQALSGFT